MSDGSGPSEKCRAAAREAFEAQWALARAQEEWSRAQAASVGAAGRVGAAQARYMAACERLDAAVAEDAR